MSQTESNDSYIASLARLRQAIQDFIADPLVPDSAKEQIADKNYIFKFASIAPSLDSLDNQITTKRYDI